MSRQINLYDDESGSALAVVALDQPDSSGACHEYEVLGPHPDPEAHRHGEQAQLGRVSFQKGSPLAAGYNGVTLEALLTIVADRLAGFEGGPLDCGENKMARNHVLRALEFLHMRTRDRRKRGVEGRMVP